MKFSRTYDLHSTRPELFELATKNFCGRFRKFDRVHDLPSASEAELHLELATKEAPTEGREEALLPEDSATMPSSTLLELRFSLK
ncbi:hypothetical protein COCNU_01G014020 [Cocos nucifera]|uniref:Uncharacterized protein n=1 Tax=Cocos nucifera TaxID=13894 RepID=A0A8K0HWH2_COCNU|nr:hypothetical protein COCNU_01G014020 [Cocos nucifera]